MEKMLILIVTVISITLAVDGRFKVGYAGTYKKDFNRNGFVLGGGAIIDSASYAGVDLSLEFFNDKFIQTFSENGYNLYTTNVKISSKTLTPSFVIGHKYVRVRGGISVMMTSIDVYIDNNHQLNDDTDVGFNVGLQVLLPIVESFDLFIEPGLVIINDNRSFSTCIGIEL